jgi:hypothetical protein
MGYGKNKPTEINKQMRLQLRAFNGMLPKVKGKESIMANYINLYLREGDRKRLDQIVKKSPFKSASEWLHNIISKTYKGEK